jgi:capsular exopolysaccharide synthesis family protein
MKEPMSEAKMHATDYWQIVRNRWGTILLTFLLVLLASLIIVNLLEKKHRGRVTMQVQSNAKDTPFGHGQSYTSGAWLETEFKIITSRETLIRVVRSLGLTKRQGWPQDENQAVDKLMFMVEPHEERGTELIAIEVYSPSPQEAAMLANAVADAYEGRRKDQMSEKAEKALDTLDKEIEDIEQSVDEKRVRMLGIAKKYNILDNGGLGSWMGKVDDPSQELYGKSLMDAADLEREINTKITTLNKIKELQHEALLEYFSQELNAGVTLKEMIPKRHGFKLEHDFLRSSGLGPNHPKVLGLKAQIDELDRILAQAVVGFRQKLETDIQIMQATLAERKDAVGKEKTTNMDMKAQHSEYLLAKREYEQQFQLLNDMREHILKERVNHVMPMAPIVRHEQAIEDPNVARPHMSLLLSIGACVGLILGMVLAFFLEYMDTSVKTLDDVERYLGVPVLAVIPKDVGVLHKQSGLSPDAEAYRILRTNIEFNRRSADANAITIVSGGAGEGKSTTLVNLAYICAQGGYNTLMIDGDLRRPKLHTFFDINNSVGLTNYLTTALMLEDVILQTPIDNLYFMPSGILPADAAGILNSRRMSELIQDLKNRFDLVLIDSPPILGVSDASVLASEVDLTIIVIQHRKLPRNMLMRVKQAVENVGGNVLGVVLNNVDVRSDSQYQYYTSYYTYYSPTAPEGKPRARARGEGSKLSASSSASESVPTGGSSDDNY